jgi:hypothetical protein
MKRKGVIIRNRERKKNIKKVLTGINTVNRIKKKRWEKGRC